MVKSLQLTEMEAIDAATMTKIFSKLKTKNKTQNHRISDNETAVLIA